MRKKLIASATLMVSAVIMAAAPAVADTKPRNHKVLVCGSSRHARNTGTVVGAVGGGLIGQAIGHNTASTVVGAGVGAVAGHEVAKQNGKRNCHYEWRRY